MKTIFTTHRENLFMTKMMLATLILFATAVSIQAQTPSSGIGYFAAGRTISTNSNFPPSVGLGVEKTFANGLGLGGELFIVCPEAAGLALTASYHFRNASSSGKLVPFVLGGVSGGDIPLDYVVGAGAHYWVTKKRGIRFEVRDLILPDSKNDHHVSVRIGFARRW